MTKKQTRPLKLKITKGKDHTFYWSLYASNSKHLVTSNFGYSTKGNAKREFYKLRDRILKHGAKIFEYDVANIEGGGQYFWINSHKIDPKTGYYKKMAISGIYTSNNNDPVKAENTISKGRQKGIMAIVDRIHKVVMI